MSQARNYNAWMLERARPHLGRRALDVGAGIGTFTEELVRLCDEVVALEPDPNDLERLRKRFASDPRVAVAGIDAVALADADLGAPFDSAICFNVLEHIADDTGALNAIHAKLRPGGKLLLLVPAHRLLFGEIDRSLAHVRRYEKRRLRARLEAARFGVDEMRHVNPLGAVGWLVSSRILRRPQVPEGPLKLYDKLVPLLSAADRLPLPFGLSLWAVATK